MLRQTVLFNGIDASGNSSLWETNGTAAGTQELAVSGAATGATGFLPNDFIVFNGEVFFAATDANGNRGLWVTNGTPPVRVS